MDEFVLEVFKACIIKAKLALQCPVRNAPMSLPQEDNPLKYRIEIH
jgi:hypothetical protein